MANPAPPTEHQDASLLVGGVVRNIASPEELTKQVFSQLLEQRYGESSKVTSITFRPLSHAILSLVMEIEIAMDGDDTDSHIPNHWIGKFLRPALPLDDMFRVEGTFYSKYADRPYPFLLASMLCQGDRCIVLEKVMAPTIKYDLLQSCPEDRLQGTIRVMAKFHAGGWGGSYKDLSPVAGIGTALTGIEKEQLFPTKWEPYVNQYFDKENDRTVSRLKDLCRSLASRRLREVHDKVHAFQPTMIHGDFHVGNLLYPKDPRSSEKVWLLDWATCGAGNPLVDLVFFLLVSTRLSYKEFYLQWLPYYHKVLTTSGDAGDDRIQQEFSWDACLELVRTCVLNQFVILVCYDNMSRNLMATQSPSQDVREHYLQHFENVNRRCVAALLSEEFDLPTYPLPSPKTAQDLQQEKQQDGLETEMLNL